MNFLRLLPLLLTITGAAWPQRVGTPTDDLDKIPLDELFSLPVTSVGRKAQQLSKAPAAIFVLTAEDIRRSGASSIPEALQWVPGLTVLRLDGRSWVVSARGSTRMYADKILVMIDGRSLYTPLFSGVIWDSIDVALDDVEQIEIVRGPGAVMWGPNAVNGVINIITRSARATKGGKISMATGEERRAAAQLRWGGQPSERLAVRLWGKLDYLTPAFGSQGYSYLGGAGLYQVPPLNDLDQTAGRFGFRLEGQPSETDQWMIQGDLFKSGRHDSVSYPVLFPIILDQQEAQTHYQGGYVQARWIHTSVGSESQLQFTYDNSRIEYPFMGGNLHNLTFDFQKRLQTSDRNEIYWGVGYQQYWDQTTTSRYAGFNPRDAVYRAGDVVLRDEWQVIPQRLAASVGIRLDYNSYHDLEYQPSIRLLYTPSARQSAWFAWSRAVRVPNRWDRDLEFDHNDVMVAGRPVHVFGGGTTSASSEAERSVEAGYRLQSGQRWSVDASVFLSFYSRLQAMNIPSSPDVVFQGAVPTLQWKITSSNPASGRNHGGEVWGTWQVKPGWRLIPSYAYLMETRWLPPANVDQSFAWPEVLANPRHQGVLRSQYDFTRSLQFDLQAKVRTRDSAFDLPGVLLVDARMGWRPTRSGELSLAVHNLTNRTVVECYPEGPIAAIPTRRTLVLKWTQRF